MAELPARVWSDDQWEQIRLGCVARSMDEKWDVFVEGQAAHLLRSWTGFEIFEATFSVVDGGWRISTAFVESDPSRYHHRSERFARVMLELVFSNILLGEPAIDLRAELVTVMRTLRSPTPRAGL